MDQHNVVPANPATGEADGIEDEGKWGNAKLMNSKEKWLSGSWVAELLKKY